MKLKPKKFRFRQDIEGFNLARGPQFGFVAQDVEGVINDLVETSMHDKILDSGEVSGQTVEIKSINYLGFIPILTRAIQEQQEEIQELKRQINLLKGSTNQK